MLWQLPLLNEIQYDSSIHDVAAPNLLKLNTFESKQLHADNMFQLSSKEQMRSDIDRDFQFQILKEQFCYIHLSRISAGEIEIVSLIKLCRI